MMRKAGKWLAIGLAVALAVGAEAAPRLTLRLENASFHEVLRQLQAFYGWEITAADGAGTDRYQPPAGAPRSTFDWRDAAPGAVFRDVGEAFKQVPRAGKRGALRFEAGPGAPAGLTVVRDGLAVTLAKVQQTETRSRPAGSPGPEVSRALRLSLVVRPMDGDPDPLYGIEQLRARDDLGHELRATPGEQRWVPGANTGLAPDEWPVTVDVPIPDPQARRLTSIEGELVLYRLARTHRMELPLPVEDPERERAAGSVRLRALEIEYTEGRLQGSFVLAWPRETELSDATTHASGHAAPLARLRDGTLVRLPVVSGGILTDESGENSVRLELRPFTLPEAPAALVWDLAERAYPERRVPFRLPSVPLPFSLEDRAPAAERGAALQIMVSTPDVVPEGEVTVGLSRQAGGKWGPVRWTKTESNERGEARLEGLQPGRYRISLRFRPRNAQGRLGAERTLRLGAGVAELTAGKLIRLRAVSN